MAAQQVPDALGIMTCHVGTDVDEAVMLEIAAVMMEALDRFLFRRQRSKIDHGQIAATGEVAVHIENIGDAARHAGGKIASGLADDEDDAAGHIFAAVVAYA